MPQDGVSNSRMQPSTILNVRVVTAVDQQQSSSRSTSAERAAKHQVVNDTRYRSRPDCVSRVTDVVGFVSQSASYSPVAVMPGCAVRSRTSWPQDARPLASDRESVLMQLTEELQQQKLIRNTSNTLSVAQTCRVDTTVIRPLAVKAQPRSTHRFHPLISTAPQVPSSTFVSSAAQNTSGQATCIAADQFVGYYPSLDRRTHVSSNETVYGPSKRSSDSSQPKLHNSSVSPYCSVESWQSYLQPVSTLPSVAFGSPTGRLYRPVGSFGSPMQMSSSLPSTAQCLSEPSRCSPVHSYQSHAHTLNYSSSAYSLTPRSQVPASPRHISPSLHTGLSSPAKSIAPTLLYRQSVAIRSPSSSSYYVKPRTSTSDVQSAVVTTSGLCRGIGSPVTPNSSGVLKLAGSVTHGTMQHIVPKFNCSQMTHSSAHVASVSGPDRSASHQTSAATSRATGSYASSGSATGLRHVRITSPVASYLPVHSCSQQQRWTSEQQLMKSYMSVLPPARPRQVTSYKIRQFYEEPAGYFRPPAPQKVACPKVSSSVQQRPDAPLNLMASPSKFFLHGNLDFDDYIGKLVTPVIREQNQTLVKSPTLPARQEAKTVKKRTSRCKVSWAVCERPVLPLTTTVTTTVSTSKLNLQGSLDVGAYIKSPLPSDGHPGNQTDPKSLSAPASDVDTKQKPTGTSEKSQSTVRAGMKRKLDLTELEKDDNSKSKMECGFVDKFQESVSIQRFFDVGEPESQRSDALPDSKCSASVPVSKKESRVYTSFLLCTDILLSTVSTSTISYRSQCSHSHSYYIMPGML